MTLDEALKELGLDRTARPEEARRAYLRLLKTRKPEVDPSGFRRLREAYERANEDLTFRERVTSAVAAAEEEVVRSSRRNPEAAAAPDPEPAPAPAPTAPAPDEGAPYRQPAAVPETATIPTPYEVEELIAASKFKGAAKALRAIYAATLQRLDVRPPPPGLTLDLILRLHEGNHVKSARRLTASFREWLAASGEEVRVLQNRAGAIWTIVSELEELPESLSPEVREALARGARSGSLGQARAELQAFRARALTRAMTDARLLRTHARVLAQYADALEWRAPAVSTAAPVRSSGGGFRPYYLLGVLLLGALRVCAAGSRSTPTFTPPNLSPLPNYNYKSSFLSSGMRTASTKALMLETAALIEGNKRVEQAAKELRDVIENDDCASATEGLENVRAAVRSSRSSTLDSKFDELDEALGKACAERLAAAARDAATSGDARAGDARSDGKASAASVKKAAARDGGPCGGAP